MFDPITQTKICSRCKQRKPISEFHRRRHYVRHGHRAACKACTRAETQTARRLKPKKEDPKKHRIRALTQEAIRLQKLVPKPCRICGSEAVQAHHPDYDAPDAHLQVDWLCEKHHSLEHGTRDWTNQLELFPGE